jgi:undecaprenyl-diphosphatase
MPGRRVSGHHLEVMVAIVAWAAFMAVALVPALLAVGAVPALRARRPLGLALVAASACASLFAATTADVLDHEALSRLDPHVHDWMVHHRAAPLTLVMEVATWLGSTATLIPVLVVFTGFVLWTRHDVRTAVQVWVALAGAVVLYNAGKDTVQRARPQAGQMVLHTTGYAFPSGHATQSAAVWGFLTFLVAARRWKAVTGAVLILAIGVSRVYLGVHWFSDVLGGWALGGTLLAVLVAFRLASGVSGLGPPRVVVVSEEVTDATDPW